MIVEKIEPEWLQGLPMCVYWGDHKFLLTGRSHDDLKYPSGEANDHDPESYRRHLVRSGHPVGLSTLWTVVGLLGNRLGAYAARNGFRGGWHGLLGDVG